MQYKQWLPWILGGLGFLVARHASGSYVPLLGNNMQISENGLDFIRRHEGFRKDAYQDIGGVWTIGYGHVISMDPNEDHSDKTVTREKAEQMLKADTEKAERCVNNNVNVSLNQNQFDALVSFVYNLGCANFKKSTLLTALNNGNFEAVPREMERWSYAGGEFIKGLANRREDEANLFTT